MRRYDIVTGILLILSIIDFALAAPVSVQEKNQPHVDVVNIPKDVTTVLGKRWEEEVEKLGEEYFESSGKPVETSGTHSSSSTAPNIASSTSPDPSTDPSCPPSSRSMHGLSARGSALTKCLGAMENMANAAHDLPIMGGGPMMYYSPPLAEYSLYRKLPATKPSINPAADPNFDWHYWLNAEDPPPPPKPSTPPRPAPPKDEGQASGHGPGPLPTGPELRLLGPPRIEFYSESVTDGHSPLSNAGWPTEPEPKPEPEVVAEPPTSPGSELHLDHLSLSAGSPQPEDLQAAIYGAKGKAKESRGISGTARDVGNAAQRELQY